MLPTACTKKKLDTTMSEEAEPELWRSRRRRKEGASVADSFPSPPSTGAYSTGLTRPRNGQALLWTRFVGHDGHEPLDAVDTSRWSLDALLRRGAVMCHFG